MEVAFNTDPEQSIETREGARYACYHSPCPRSSIICHGQVSAILLNGFRYVAVPMQMVL